jgi:hypothetical protein
MGIRQKRGDQLSGKHNFPPFLQREHPLHLFDMRVGRPKSRLEPYGIETSLYPYREFNAELKVVQFIAQSLN